MAQATVRDYGTIYDFDPMCYDNNYYDLWCVAVCDPETDEVEGEEHYVSESEYRSALRDTEGREVMDEQTQVGFCDVIYNGECYEFEAIYHIAYVFDYEEE